MKTRIRSGIQSVCLVLPIVMLALGTSAFGQQIRFYPIRTAPLGSPAGTGSPWLESIASKSGLFHTSAPENGWFSSDLQWPVLRILPHFW